MMKFHHQDRQGTVIREPKPASMTDPILVVQGHYRAELGCSSCTKRDKSRSYAHYKYHVHL
jgi:hypothetical protein